MIHSLAGGDLKDEQIKNIALLEFIIDKAEKTEKHWYYFENIALKKGDKVLAPFGVIDELFEAKVLEVYNNVKGSNFPISLKKLKKIYKKC